MSEPAQTKGEGVGASVVGDAASLRAGEVLLPSFVEQRAAGLFVDPAGAARDGGILPFVERVFTAGARFADLDYPVFLNLLYGLNAPPAAPVRLAADIVAFPPARRALYRAAKIAPDKSTAEYLFEPVEIEIEETVPVFGAPAADGSVEVLGEEVRKHGEPARLDFDEFVAAMWEKGVRFGIDPAGVRAAIQSAQPTRLLIAHALPPTPGRAATIEEKTDALHRDNAPKIRPDGRMDLSQFKNRFPQVAGGTRLLQKLPSIPGKLGRDVAGAPLEPEAVPDFDFSGLAGPGTTVVKGADGEFIVSAQDGFLNVDAQTNQVSVTEKIVSHEGVSMKATGDVVLTGDEFEEHGEVQDKRGVEGLHMTFFADVYGRIVSRGGRVIFKASIAGGQATSPGGSIVVEGRASRATLEARGGEVQVEFAEGCTIVASRVTVNHAVNCDILGEAVAIGVSEGSAIAGKQVKIAQSTTRKDTETIVSVLVPDMKRHDQEVAELEEARQQAKKLLAAQDAKLAQMQEDSGFKQFLALALTIAKGGAKLSPQHQANWNSAQARFAPQMREWQAAQQVCATARKKLETLAAQLAALAEQKMHAGDGIGCTIESVTGDTLVRRLAFQQDRSITEGTQAHDLAAHLRELGTGDDRLFWAGTGEFSWNCNPGAGAAGEA